MRNMVVGIVCAVLVLIHLLVGLIAHKLDHLESLRLSQVPLCGRPGLYHYRVLVKTGWRRGAGQPRTSQYHVEMKNEDKNISKSNESIFVFEFMKLYMMEMINAPIRYHSTCWHQPVWSEQEWLSPSAEGWSISAW